MRAPRKSRERPMRAPRNSKETQIVGPQVLFF
jgi:hypothetical protein